MRVFELTARVEAISRGEKGGHRSATAAAAYRACCAIDCEREGRTHDYTRKQGLEASAIILPEGAAEQFNDRSILWNAAEMRERNGARGKRAGAFKQDAQVAREVLFTFPAELSAAGRLAAAERIARHLVETHGVAADYSLHLPGKDGDQQNFHCHLMMTTRRLGPEGLGEKVREWSNLYEGRTQTRDIRGFIAATLNDQLRQEGHADAVHVEHRSFAERGSGQRPTIHQGPTRTNILRKAQGRALRAWQAEQRQAINHRHGQELATLKAQHVRALDARKSQWAEREQASKETIGRDLAVQRKADRPQRKTGIAGMLHNLTGRTARDASEHRARDSERVAEATRQMKAIRAEIAQERRAFIGSIRQDRESLIDRQKQETGRIQKAAEARQQIDRGAERAARQPPGPSLQQEQMRRRGRGIGRDFSP